MHSEQGRACTGHQVPTSESAQYRTETAQMLYAAQSEAPTRLEDVDETHEQRAQFLAIERMLLFTHFHSELLCNNILQKNANQL